MKQQLPQKKARKRKRDADADVEPSGKKKRERNLPANVPVHIISKHYLGLQLMRHPELKLYLLQLLVYYAVRCDIEILYFGILGNHFHLILRQYFKGADDFEGIGATLRNALSRFSRDVGVLLDLELGTKYQGRYKHFEIRTSQQLLRTMLYLTIQAQRHGIDESEVLTALLSLQQGTGNFVSHFPSFPELGDTEDQRRLALHGILQRSATRYRELASLHPMPDGLSSDQQDQFRRQLMAAALDQCAPESILIQPSDEISYKTLRSPRVPDADKRPQPPVLVIEHEMDEQYPNRVRCTHVSDVGTKEPRQTLINWLRTRRSRRR